MLGSLQDGAEVHVVASTRAAQEAGQETLYETACYKASGWGEQLCEASTMQVAAEGFLGRNPALSTCSTVLAEQHPKTNALASHALILHCSSTARHCLFRLTELQTPTRRCWSQQDQVCLYSTTSAACLCSMTTTELFGSRSATACLDSVTAEGR